MKDHFPFKVEFVFQNCPSFVEITGIDLEAVDPDQLRRKSLWKCFDHLDLRFLQRGLRICYFSPGRVFSLLRIAALYRKLNVWEKERLEVFTEMLCSR